MNFKRGKLPPKAHKKTLHLKDYLGAGMLPNAAKKVWREYKTPENAKSMYGNDLYGCCVWAMLANALISMTAHTGQIVIPTLADALTGYAAVTGFSAGPPVVNDNGTAITDALDYLRTVGLAGHKILAWAKIDHTNLTHRRIAADLFGGTLVGVQLPADAEDQFDLKQAWEVTGAKPDPDAGHAIFHPGYGSEGGDYVSWKRWDQKASAAWESECIDEEYALITEDFINQVTQETPGGLNLAELEVDIAML